MGKPVRPPRPRARSGRVPHKPVKPMVSIKPKEAHIQWKTHPPRTFDIRKKSRRYHKIGRKRGRVILELKESTPFMTSKGLTRKQELTYTRIEGEGRNVTRGTVKRTVQTPSPLKVLTDKASFRSELLGHWSGRTSKRWGRLPEGVSVNDPLYKVIHGFKSEGKLITDFDLKSMMILEQGGTRPRKYNVARTKRTPVDRRGHVGPAVEETLLIPFTLKGMPHKRRIRKI